MQKIGRSPSERPFRKQKMEHHFYKSLSLRNHKKGNERARWHNKGEICAWGHWKVPLSCNGVQRKQCSVDLSLQGRGILDWQIWICHRKSVWVWRAGIRFAPFWSPFVCIPVLSPMRFPQTGAGTVQCWAPQPLPLIHKLQREQLQGKAALRRRRTGSQGHKFLGQSEQQLVLPSWGWAAAGEPQLQHFPIPPHPELSCSDACDLA